MASCSLMFFVLLALVVTVHSSTQTYPRFEFRGNVLTNNSFVLRGQVNSPTAIGEGVNNSLHCVTDYMNCCNSGLGKGNWYDPRGMEVSEQADGDSDSYVTRGDGVVYLNLRRGGQSGMWRCDIPDNSGHTQSIYIYMGTGRNGELNYALFGIIVHSEPNENPPEFTLTCRSEGGPATTVMWWRDLVPVQEDSNHETSQIIVDTSEDTVYHNKLRVRGREGGLYTCNVSNNIQEFVSDLRSSALRSIRVKVAETPTQLNAIYKSATSISLEWTYTLPILLTISYVLYYEYAGGSVRRDVSVSGEVNSYLLTGLPIGGVHSISIVAMRHLPGDVVGPVDPVVEPPEVTLSGSGSRVAGTSYTLTCTVTPPTGVQFDSSFPPNIQWLGPDTTHLTPTVSSQMSSGVYISNITLNPLQETHSGQYSCRASYHLGSISSKVVTDEMNITVISLTAPGVTVRDEGIAVAGSDYTLICKITIPTFSHTITVSMPFVTWTYPSGETERAFGNSVQLVFSPLTSDDDGVYTCMAYYFVNGIASPQGSSTFSLGDLSAKVTGSGSGEAGSPYTLTCTVTLLHRASDSSVSIQWQGPHPHTVTTTTDISTNEVVSGQLPLDPLTLTDGGDYTCTATYTVGEKTSEGMGNTTIIVIIPPPSVTITMDGGVDDRVLVGDEVVLYCDIELSGVMRGSDVTVDVTWFKDSAPFNGAVTSDNGDTVQSTVTFSPVHFPDNATYVCQVTITPLNEGQSTLVAASSDSFLLSVIEPTSPIFPSDLISKNVTTDSAIIQWTVSYISYSPETYVVKYGTSQDTLIQNSSTIYSGDDITITDMTYSVKLSNLKENTTYYVQVVATNTAQISSMSSVEQFRTFCLMEIQPAGDTTSVVAGVMSLVIILISGVAAFVIILLLLKIRNLRLILHAHDVTQGNKVSEEEHKTVPTATNVAYGMVSSSTTQQQCHGTEEPAYAVITDK